MRILARLAFALALTAVLVHTATPKSPYPFATRKAALHLKP